MFLLTLTPTKYLYSPLFYLNDKNHGLAFANQVTVFYMVVLFQEFDNDLKKRTFLE